MGQRVAVASSRSRSYARNKSAAQALRLRVDVPLLGTITTLLAFGLLMVFSASWDVSLYLYGSHSGVFARQLMWLGLGSVAMMALIFINYHWLAQFVVPAMGVAIALLIGVLVIGGFFQIQTLQKVPQIGMLKAIGTPSAIVAIAAMTQIVVVTLAGVAIGSLATFGLSLIFPPNIPIVFELGSGAIAMASILLMGPIGGLVSIRQSLRVEPLIALGLG